MLALGVVWLAVAAPGVEIRWDAPPGCPEGPAVEARVLEQADPLGRAATLQVTGTIRTLVDGRYELKLEIVRDDDPPDRRRIVGDSCEVVTSAAAIIVALRWVGTPIDDPPIPDAAEVSPLDDEPSVPPPSVPPPSDPPLADPSPSDPSSAEPTSGRTDAPAPIEPPGWHEPGPAPTTRRDREAPAIAGWVSLAGGMSLGVLPGVGAAARVAGGIDGRHFRVGVFAHGRPARRTDHPERPDVGGRFDLVTGGALGCGLLHAGRFSFPLCGSFEAGGLRGVGEGAVADPRPGFSPWLGLGLEAGATWRALRWLAPFVSLQGTVGLVRPGFTVGGVTGTIYEAGRVGMGALAGIEFRFESTSRKSPPAETQ